MTLLRLLILTPTAFPKTTGNATSAERWRRALSEQGAVVKVVETKQTAAQDLIRCLESFRPHIIHAHHISLSGGLMLDPLISERYGSLPLVISSSGNDVNKNQLKKADIEELGKICRRARFIIAQSSDITMQLQKILPGLNDRIVYVAKAFSWFGDDCFDLRSAAGCQPDDILFFMPAGIRPVKGNLECLLALEETHSADGKIRALFAGPALDPVYANRFTEEIQRLQTFARWIQIPLQAMRSAYTGADVVLNHSSSEGLSNALIEAVAAGRPVLASDIPGNSWLRNTEKDADFAAWFFDPNDRADFVRKALRLAEPAHRESLAAAARRMALRLPQARDEARYLLEIYKKAGRLQDSTT